MCPDIVFILCKNEDGFHGTCDYMLRYVILDGRFTDEPNSELTKRILAENPKVPVLLVISPCRSCRAKGVTGPTTIGYLDRED